MSSRRINRYVNRYARAADTSAVVAAMRGPEPAADTVVNDEEPVRRWSAAETTRLNRGYWHKANNNTINQDLRTDLVTLQARCALERARNPFLDGVINTHADDVVGQSISLQVQSDNALYNQRLEEAWAEYWDCPDINGQLSGIDMMRLGIQQCWDKGDLLLRRTSLREPLTLVGYRVQAIDAGLLQSRPSDAGDPTIVSGVRLTASGRAIQYTLRSDAGSTSTPPTYQDVDAEELIHYFRITEPGQARGYPWSAVSLDTLAQLRDFDSRTLDAARAAAAFGVVLASDHPDAPFVTINDSTPIENFVTSTLPPGYTPQTIQSHHPGPQYKEFRHERLREVGRPVSMPLLKILLGAEDHSFASARMDAQNYNRALGVLQAGLAKRVLIPQVDDVARELMLVKDRRGRFVLPPRPSRVRYVFTFTKQPHVDPLKEANAEAVRLNETRTLTFRDACGEGGHSEDEVMQSWAQSYALAERYGLPRDFFDRQRNAQIPPAPVEIAANA